MQPQQAQRLLSPSPPQSPSRQPSLRSCLLRSKPAQDCSSSSPSLPDASSCEQATRAVRFSSSLPIVLEPLSAPRRGKTGPSGSSGSDSKARSLSVRPQHCAAPSAAVSCSERVRQTQQQRQPCHASPPAPSPSVYASACCRDTLHAIVCLTSLAVLLPLLLTDLQRLSPSSLQPSSPSSPAVRLPWLLPVSAQSYPDYPLFWTWSGALNQTTAGGSSITIQGNYFLTPGACTIPPAILFTFSDGSQGSCVVTSQITTTMVCTVPPGYGTPHVTINICGQLNRDLPVVPSNFVYYVGSTPPMSLAWCHLWNNSQAAGFTWSSPSNWFCSSDQRQKLSATGHNTPDRPLFTSCAPDWSYSLGGDPTCASIATNKRCIQIYDPLQPGVWNFTNPSNASQTWPHLFCTETASPYYFVFYPNCTSPTCASQCVQILNPNAASTTWTSGNAYLCTTTYPSPFPAPDLQLLYHYAAPVITSVTPANCSTTGGTVVTLRGSSFGFANVTSVTLLPSLGVCNVSFLNHTYATCSMPPGQGPVYFLINVDGIVNTALFPFTYNSPVITSVLPQLPNAAGGSLLTISGSNFGTSGTVTVAISIGATLTQSLCYPQSLYNNTEIICAAPPGQGVNQAVYVTSSQTMNLVPFPLSYLPPAVSSVAPLSFITAGNTVLNVSGTSFGTTGSVTVGGVACPLTGIGYSNTAIQCILPAGQGLSQAVVVTASGQASSPSGSFGYSAPNVSSVVVSRGVVISGGSAVTIIGTSFGNGTSGSVLINGLPCTVGASQWQQASIVCAAPASSGVNVPLLVNVSGQLSNLANFSYSATISNVSAPAGRAPTTGGVAISVSGVGFSTAAVAPATVYFGASVCSPVVNQSSGSLSCTLPAGSGTVSVIVQVAGLNSSSFSFSYDAPSISWLQPSIGPTAGGTTLTVYGVNFGLSPTATVNGQSCAVTGQSNNTFLTCIAPAGSGVSNPVVVSTGGGQYTPSAPYAYFPPSITSFSPTLGAPAGGYNLTLWGGNFSLASSLTFVVINGLSVSPLWQNDSLIVASVPPYTTAAVVYPAVIVNGQTCTTPQAFTYLGANITAVTPVSGTANTAGGAVLNISGTNFGSNGYVLVGRLQAALVSYSNTFISCIIPAGQGSSPISVTVGTTAAMQAWPWTYAAPSISLVNPPASDTSGNVLLTLSGANFGTSGAVTIGAYACSTTYPGASYSTNSIICQLPPGQGAGLQVTVNVSSLLNTPTTFFSYNPPLISSVVPASGPTAGGGVITVYGNNFGLVAVTTLVASSGGNALLCAAYGLGQSHTQIQCTVPGFQGASVPVFVSVSGQVANFSYAFTPPSLSSISPQSAATAGGASLTLSGLNFGSGASFGLVNYNLTMAGVSVAPLSVTLYNQTSVVFPCPAGSGAIVPISLTVAGQTAVYSGVAFSYAPPALLQVSGCTGSSGNATTLCSTTAATVLNITGYNFGPNVSQVAVSVGGVSCPVLPSPFVPHFLVSCTLQPVAAGGFNLPVLVTANGLSGSASLLSFSGPVIYPNTLVAAGLSSTVVAPTSVPSLSGGNLQLSVSTAASPFNVSFNGQSWGNDSSQVWVAFGPTGGPKPYNCSIWQLFSDVLQNSTLTCAIGPGVGANLSFVVHVRSQASLESADSLSFIPPQIVANSLSLSGQSGSSVVHGASSYGDSVTFTALYVGTVQSRLSVLYGTALPFTLACTQLALTNASTAAPLLTCLTAPGSGNGYHFQVLALNALSAAGTDTYDYVTAAAVYQVRGCTDNLATNSTAGCPTLGGTTITLTGSSFSASSLVSIGSLSCASVNLVSSSVLTCVTPAQAGSGLGIIVTTGLTFSSTVYLLSYAPASVTQISGCVFSFYSTVGCSRQGGQTVVLSGSNFGPGTPTVLINGLACSGVSAAANESTLTCTTPAGTGTLNSIILIQDGGVLSIAAGVYLSYLQCAPGSFAVSGNISCGSCQPGTYAAVSGLTACQNCIPGTFALGYAATGCSSCSAGSYSGAIAAGAVGASSCTACAAGSFNAANSSTTCAQCSPGSFNTANSSTSCSTCQPGNYSGTAGAAACSICPIGQYSDYAGAVQCIACPAGSIANSSTAGVSGCTDCPAGSFAPSAGLTQCQACGVGTYSPTSRLAACLACDPGSFGNGTGLTACFSCQPGSYSVSGPYIGATGCSACGVGTYTDVAGQEVCLQCGQGSFSAATSASACQSCQPGQFTSSLGQTACSGCPMGTYSNTNRTAVCSACPVGSFTNVTGATGCASCPAGSVQPLVNQSSCSACPLGTYMSGTGQAVCLVCDPGSYADVPGLSACLPCPAGASCPKVAGSSVGPVTYSLCQPGSYSVGSQEACLLCNAGQYQNATGGTGCLPCPAGEAMLQTGASQCSACQPGQYASDTGFLTCLSCAIGSFSAGYGALGCTGCSSGTYAPSTGASQCYACAAGSYTGSLGQGSCLPCAAGTFSNTSQSSSCLQCPVGTYQPASGLTVCAQCSPGSAQGAVGQVSCNQCPAGSFSSGLASVSCSSCPLGTATASTGVTGCAQCQPGYYAGSTGQLQCASCPVGSYSSGNASTGCSPCLAGYYANAEGSSACTGCLLGTYSGSTGTIQCYPCNAGSYSYSNGSTACAPCGIGTFQGLSGQQNCSSCPYGTYSPTAAAQQCLSCPVGTVPLPYLFNGVLEGSTSCGDCPAGSYQPTAAGSVCLTCAAGSYTDLSGQSSCIPCGTGSFASGSNSTGCTDCGPGTYQSQTGSGNCNQCPLGQYSNATAASACLSCSPGSFTSTLGNVECSLCGVGQYQSLGGQRQCLPCPTGSFTNQIGVGSCAFCPPGSFQNLTGQTGCLPCPLGSNQSTSGQSGCGLCPAGTYASNTGLSTCLACAAGSFQNLTGQIGCVSCAIGSAQGSNGATSCSACAAGSVMPYPGYSACTPCAPGYFITQQGGVNCTACGVGTFAAVQGSSSCANCSAGSYQNSVGQSACVNCGLGTASNLTALTQPCAACSVGSYAGQPGQTSCSLCPAATAAPTAGLSACALCATGSFQNQNGSTGCRLCSVGSHQPYLGGTSCLACDPGTYAANPGQTDCTACPAGQFNNATNQTVCTGCPPGDYQQIPGQTGCDPCQPGSANPSSAQAICPACQPGYYQPGGGDIECLSCPPGQYQQQNGALNCSFCDLGFYQPSLHQPQCLAASAGYFTNVTGATLQTPCAAGTYQPSNNGTACLLCPVGSYQPSTGQPICTECPAGRFTNTTGCTACLTCPEGSQQPTPGSSFCIACDAGSYSDVQGTASCPFCAAGSFSNESAATGCLPCAIGYQQPNNNATVCEQCEPGTAAEATGSATCPSCLPGSYMPYFGYTSCFPCPAQQAQIDSGQSQCDWCAPGTYNSNSTGLSVCNQCEPGTFTNDTGAAACTDCSEGEAQPSYGAIVCIACLDGEYAPQPGLASCEGCPAGSFSNSTNSSLCLPCQEGQYQPTTGQTNCLNCPLGTFIDLTGKASCTQCPAGSVSPVTGATSCDSCTAGSYQGVSGQAACLACPVGTYNDVEGATQCAECGYGQYADSEGSLSCSSCPIGSYKDEVGGGDCLPCNPGEWNPGTGAKVCQSCPTGQHSNATLAEYCVNCEIGTANDAVNQSACAACKPGFYQSNMGQKECLPCPVGFYTASNGSVTCLACPVGTYQDLLGSTSCQACRAGQTTSGPGLFYCVDCPTGSFGNASAAGGFCSSCPAGTYNVNTGMTVCVDCDAGYYSTAGQQVCTACADLTVTAAPGASQCVPCDSNSVSNLTHTACLCNPGWYLPVTHVAGSSYFSCAPCPQGASCLDYGTTFYNLGALAGWWRSGNDTLNFYECPIAEYCLGGAASGGNASSSATACTDNRGGILCSTCLTGYHEETGGSCVLCPAGGTSWTSVALIAAGVLFLVWLQITIVIRSGRDEITRGLQSDAAADSSGTLHGLDDDGSESSSDDSSDEDDSSSDESESESHSSRSGSRSSKSGSKSSRSSRSSKPGNGSDSESSQSHASTTGGDEADGSDGQLSEGGESEESEEEEEEPVNAMERVDPARINFHVRYGPPEPQHDFTYKLKIFLSFLQVATNLGTNLNIVWPTVYVNFLLFFDVANFDFALSSAASADCIGIVNYYNEYVVICLAPAVILAFTVLFYLLPNYLECGPFRSKTLQERQRGKMNFWRLFLYLLFLVYPAVSSTVLRLYVCRQIDDQYYLTTDLTVQCYTSTWTSFTYASLLLILIYPIGIPIFFFSILRVNQTQLRQPRIRAQLGFLYAGYRGECWWFEIAESIHKLTLTSVLAFLPPAAQRPTGMGVCCLYFLVVLTVNPYLSSFDDLLALYSECEIFLLITAGWIFYNEAPGADSNNLLLSLCLIAITVFFFLAFLFAALYVVVVVAVRWKTKRRVERIKRMKEQGLDDAVLREEEAAAAAAAAAALPVKPKREFVFNHALGEEDSEQSASSRGRHSQAEHSDGDDNSEMGDLDVGSDEQQAAGRRSRKERPEEKEGEALSVEDAGAGAQTVEQRAAAALRAKQSRLLSPAHAVHTQADDSDDEGEEEVVDVFGLNLDEDGPRSARTEEEEEKDRRRQVVRQQEEEDEDEDEDVLQPRVRRDGEEEDITKNMANIITASSDR